MTSELNRVSIRLTDTELEYLDAQAQRRRMPRSTLIKEAIAVAVSPPDQEVNQALCSFGLRQKHD